MKIRLYFQWILFCFITLPMVSFADTLVEPINNPANAHGSTEFDWQEQWGSIHMNSLADGLLDPGAPASKNSTVPCQGALCDTMKTNSVIPGGSDIDNGIKYDIKNSLLNCMSKPVPNWALLPGRTTTYANGYVCTAGHNMKPLDPAESAVEHHDLRTMIYLPLWDRRSNDARAEDQGQPVGCQQQIANTCGGTRDIHACVNPADGNPYATDGGKPGYKFPVSHVFSPQEIEDLGGKGKQLPRKYYKLDRKITKTTDIIDGDTIPNVGTYTEDSLSFKDVDCKVGKDKDGKDIIGKCKKYSYTRIDEDRPGLSRSLVDKVPGSSHETINFGTDPNLARIKSYTFSNAYSEDATSFVIMDPRDFFDLRLYVDKTKDDPDPIKGKYASGYSQFDAAGKVKTYESCPVLGLTSGYSGICDPTGNAGCNLPIYKKGPETSFKDVSNLSYTYNHYPIVWSGYVRKWALITVDQYLQNIASRGSWYAHNKKVPGSKSADLNDNPILMINRAPEYCDIREMMSKIEKVKADTKPNMDCVQYLQYQDVGIGDKKQLVFVDLFTPEEDPFYGDPPAELEILRLFNIGSNGLPDINNPIRGKGFDQDIGGTGDIQGFLSYADIINKEPEAVFNDYSRNIVKASPLQKVSYAGELKFENGKRLSGPVKNTSGINAPGEYLGVDEKAGTVDTSKGAGLSLEIGTGNLIRLAEELSFADGYQSVCSFVSYIPGVDRGNNNLFVPSNSSAEYQAFVNAAQSGSVPGVIVRRCTASFQDNATVAATSASKPATGTTTWVGNLSCNELVERPACNQTKMITAQRRCQLENGSLDNCGSCGGQSDPDAGIPFTNESVGGEILVNPLHSSSKCYFSAACFNNSASGCPVAGTSGGHVFCLAADTKVTMADGTEKDINKIKAGEKVKAFDARSSRSTGLKTASVKATTVTRSQEVMKINGLRITPLHKVILSSGRAVMAKDLKVGDKIIKADGVMEAVTTVETEKKKIDVYNLVLEDGADGYIAGGVRVLAYPMLKGLASR